MTDDSKDDRGKRISEGLRAWHAKRTAEDKKRTHVRRQITWKRNGNKLRGKFTSYFPLDDSDEEL